MKEHEDAAVESWVRLTGLPLRDLTVPSRLPSRPPSRPRLDEAIRRSHAVCSLLAAVGTKSQRVSARKLRQALRAGTSCVVSVADEVDRQPTRILGAVIGWAGDGMCSIRH